ncbi:hypothetical protein [Actinomadura madurae]|uniref:hypothetical protein n=1 Tax=Actinomadura madurae TaxID=1993 RepID=UPI003558BD64
MPVSTVMSDPVPGTSSGTVRPSVAGGASTPPRPACRTVVGRLSVSRPPDGLTAVAVAAVAFVTTGSPAAMVSARASPGPPTRTGGPRRPSANGETCPSRDTGTHRVPRASMPACPRTGGSAADAPTGARDTGSICWTTPLTESTVYAFPAPARTWRPAPSGRLVPMFSCAGSSRLTTPVSRSTISTVEPSWTILMLWPRICGTTAARPSTLPAGPLTCTARPLPRAVSQAPTSAIRYLALATPTP